MAAYGSSASAVTATVTTAIATPYPISSSADGDPPPAHPPGAAAGVGQREGRRAAGRPPTGDGGATRGSVSTTPSAVSAEGDGPRRRSRRSRRPGRRSRMAANRARPPNQATTAPSAGGEDGDDERLDPDQPAGLARGGADGAEQPDLDARWRTAMPRVEATEKSTIMAPQPPTTAPMMMSVSRSASDTVPRRGLDQGGERPDQRGAEQDREEGRGERGRAEAQRRAGPGRS